MPPAPRTPATRLLVTRGFHDILEIRRLLLDGPTNLHGDKPLPLVPRHLVGEIDERCLSAFVIPGAGGSPGHRARLEAGSFVVPNGEWDVEGPMSRDGGIGDWHGAAEFPTRGDTRAGRRR